MPKAKSRVTDQLEALFGSDIECPLAILDVLNNNDGSELGAKDLVAATGYRLVEVLVAVARLTYGGLIEHPAAGRYCSLESQRAERVS